MGDKWETSVNACGPRHLEWEISMGDKWKTSVNSCGPRHPECDTSVGDKCETRPVWETSGKHVGDKCKLMRPKAPRVGDKCGRQVWRQVGDECKIMPQDTQSERQGRETSGK